MANEGKEGSESEMSATLISPLLPTLHLSFKIERFSSILIFVFGFAETIRFIVPANAETVEKEEDFLLGKSST